LIQIIRLNNKYFPYSLFFFIYESSSNKEFIANLNKNT
jgi:hypothetical protein